MEQETRIAVVGIIVENKEAVGEVNQILHVYIRRRHHYVEVPR